MNKPNSIAIISHSGSQHVVSAGAVLTLPKMSATPGSEIVFDRVLLKSGTQTDVGRPEVKGAVVKGKVLEHGRTRKVIGVKFHNKVRYRRTFGHRQDWTKVRIESVD